jgi:hypothetical protein
MSSNYTAKYIALLIDASPRTTGRAELTIDAIKRRAFNETRYSTGLPLESTYRHIGTVAQRVQHVAETGRIHGATVLAFRDMKPYQVCKLVARIAASLDTFAGMMDDEAVAVIRDAINRNA